MRLTKSGQSAMNKKPWKFEKQMEFLKPYVEYGRDGRSNVRSPQSPSSVVSDDEGNNTEIPQASSRESTPVETPLASPITPTATESSTGTKKRKASTAQRPALVAFEEYMNYKKSKGNKTSDHLTKYFASVEETVRTFPIDLQIKIKSEFSSILHKAEYEAILYSNRLKDSQPFTSNTSIHHSTNFNNQMAVAGNRVQQSPNLCSSEACESTLQTLGHGSPGTWNSQQSLLETSRDGTHNIPVQQLSYHTLEEGVQYNYSLHSQLRRQEMLQNMSECSEKDGSLSTT